MAQTILGIDVGSYSVKVAEVVRTFKGFVFCHFYERKIPFNEVLTREESIIGALQGLLEDHALTWDACFAALPGKIVATRFLDFPFGQAKKIDQAIPYEIENHIPFPLEDIVLDYHVASAGKDFANAIVFYAAKSECAKHLHLLTIAGVDPRRLCVEGVELVNLMHLGLVPPEAPYAILDIGHEKTTVTICRGKRLMHTRTLTIAGAHITRAIAERCNVSFDEAERLKHELGEATAGDEWPAADSIPFHVAKAIDAVLEELLLHIRQTFFAYRERAKTVVEAVYLCGGTARLRGLDSYLSIRLKQNVTPLDCTAFHFAEVDPAEAPAAIMPTALGLALRGVAAAGMPDVNFRREEFAYRGDVEQLGGGLRRAGMAAAFLVCLAIGYFAVQYVLLTRKAAQLNKEVAQLVTQALGKKPAKPIADAESALRLLKTEHEELGERIKQLELVVNISPLEVLKDLSAQLPSRGDLPLDVRKFELKEGKVYLEGHTASFEASAKLEESLSRSTKFANVQKSGEQKGTKGEVKFKLEFEVKELTPTAPPSGPKGKGKST